MREQQAVTIVMIEDDAGHALLIEKNIRRAGVSNRIETFASGGAALDYLIASAGESANTAYLILLDLNLPDMSGTEILRKVKEHPVLHSAPVVVLTTTDDRLEIQHCYELGCNVYITKPVNYENFAQAIKQLGMFFMVMRVPEVAA